MLEGEWGDEFVQGWEDVGLTGGLVVGVLRPVNQCSHPKTEWREW